MDPDPNLGDVTQEEGEAMEVRPPVTQQRRRRWRRSHRQREEVAAQDEQEQEYNRRLSDKVLWKCSDEELELVFPDGRGRNFMQIIAWARRRVVMAPHPATRAKWDRFFQRYDRSIFSMFQSIYLSIFLSMYKWCSL